MSRLNSVLPQHRAGLIPALLFFARFAVGSIFVLFALGKATQPLSQFVEAIQAYQFLPEAIIPPFAAVMIVLELLFGALLLVGLYERYAAAGICGLLVMFMAAILIALARGVNLTDCGCSGGFIELGETPLEVLIRDVILLVGALWVWRSRAHSALRLESLLTKKS